MSPQLSLAGWAAGPQRQASVTCLLTRAASVPCREHVRDHPMLSTCVLRNVLAHPPSPAAAWRALRGAALPAPRQSRPTPNDPCCGKAPRAQPAQIPGPVPAHRPTVPPRIPERSGNGRERGRARGQEGTGGLCPHPRGEPGGRGLGVALLLLRLPWTNCSRAPSTARTLPPQRYLVLHVHISSQAAAAAAAVPPSQPDLVHAWPLPSPPLPSPALPSTPPLPELHGRVHQAGGGDRAGRCAAGRAQGGAGILQGGGWVGEKSDKLMRPLTGRRAL